MPKRRKRDTARRRGGSSRKVRRRMRWILVVLGGAIGLYVYDYRAPLETVRGRVASTRTYPHRGTGGRPHTHIEAVIEYEGARHTLPRADGLRKGQGILVDVRRGRLSGRLRYVSFRPTASGAAAGTQPGSSQPVPWVYDLIEDRHWNPIHGHWHDGPPPPLDQRAFPELPIP